jgi:hypothetical protein
VIFAGGGGGGGGGARAGCTRCGMYTVMQRNVLLLVTRRTVVLILSLPVNKGYGFFLCTLVIF